MSTEKKMLIQKSFFCIHFNTIAGIYLCRNSSNSTLKNIKKDNWMTMTIMKIHYQNLQGQKNNLKRCCSIWNTMLVTFHATVHVAMHIIT